MLDLSTLEIRPAPPRDPLPPASELGFGRLFAPRVLVVDHDAQRGWHAPRIVPLAQASTAVATGALQYALSVFEGLKAFRGPNGSLHLFRPDRHGARLANSARLVGLPALPPDDFVELARALVREEEPSCPEHGDGSLYLRPTVFASESFLGVRPSTKHQLVILLSPVGAYFSTGRPLRLWAERERVRAAPGGLGAAKTGANYAASVVAAEHARARGFDQVLWLDAVERRWLAEVGTMNLFVELADRVVTPPLDDTILAGVTRDSALALLREWGVAVEERPIALQELAEASRAGTLRGLFGTGTAAVVTEVGEVAWDGGEARAEGGAVAARLKQAMTSIQRGQAPDPRGWRVPV